MKKYRHAKASSKPFAALFPAIATLALIGVTGSSRAGELKAEAEMIAEPETGYVIPGDQTGELFKAGETHLRFGYASLDQHGYGTPGKETDGKDEEVGVAIEVSHYFNRFLAGGIEYVISDDFGYDQSAAALATLRVPWDEGGFAFLIKTGLGGVFGDYGDEWAFHIGGGIEARLLENLSLLAEYRYVETGGEYEFYMATYSFSILF